MRKVSFLDLPRETMVGENSRGKEKGKLKMASKLIVRIFKTIRVRTLQR